MANVRLSRPQHHTERNNETALTDTYGISQCPGWEMERLRQNELFPLSSHLSLHVV
jgi:hypothetical protein